MCLSLATDTLCCAGSTFCSLACCCCKSCLGTTFKEQVKLAYILLNYFVITFTIVVLYFLQQFYSKYSIFFGCPNGGGDLCLGVSGVYRMSFILCLMYFILMFCMLFRGQFAKEVNEGIWGIKVLFIVGGFYGSLYIPNTFFEYYVDFSAIISGVYMVFQIVIFIDIFYKWAENWIQQYDEGIEGMAGILIGTCSFLFLGALVLSIYNFLWFEEYFLTNLITVILILIMTVVQLQGYNSSGSLLVTSSIALYMTFQVFSALSSLPDKNVNLFYYSKQLIIVQMVIGFVFNFGALIYMIFATQEYSKQRLDILDKREEKSQGNQQQQYQVQPIEIELTSEQRVTEARAIIQEDALRQYRTNQYVIFHLIMMITSIYMGMMITNWGAPNITDKTRDIFKLNWISYYMKLGSAWICSFLYLWTLIAPQIYPERFQ